MKISFFTTILALAALTSCNIYQPSGKKIITIGSGSKNAMYYPVATALCNVFNKHNQDKNISCEARVSRGAEYNLDAVENSEFDFGISQVNLQYDAFNGKKKFTQNPHKNLRSVFELHREYLTIVAKKEANITNFSDLKGKKVNIGNVGSGSRILFLQMINELGWTLDDFTKAYEESGSNIDKVLCVPSKADAAIYIVGHANKSFEKVLNNCNTELVSLDDAEINKFITIAPKEFKKFAIPKNTYSQNSTAIKTFAVKTILSVSKNLDKRIVQNFVKIISENKQELIKEQPALSTVKFFTKDYPDLAPLYEGLNNSGKKYVKN